MPPAGADIIIPAGKVVTLDINSPALAGLRIEGTLRFARADIALTASYIDVTGALEIGTATAPFTQKATITLTGAPQATNDGVSRGLNVRGGRLELYGSAPSPVWTKLNEHAAAGATTLTLKDSTTGWRSGDVIAVAPSDFYSVGPTERMTLSGANGVQLTLANGLARSRWGKLQYVTNNGIGLVPDPTYTPPAAPAPTEIDERAAVANLTRNIVIQGVNDAAWQNSAFGAHVMVMNLASKVVVDGVEFRRVGQGGVTGRYPFHWHRLSYNDAGQMVGDATGHVLRNSSIWASSNRCVVIHATNGVQVLNNICQDIQGHAFFLEDAVERRNVFDGNLALTTRSPIASRLLQVHEGSSQNVSGPAGFWLTNPDNIVRNNLAGDSAGNGFWMAFPTKTLGLSANVALVPSSMQHGVFEFNTSHSSAKVGVLLDNVPIDAAGNLTLNYYIPTDTGTPSGNPVKFTLKRITSYKNIGGAYRNRAVKPEYLEWVTADNDWRHFDGAVQQGVLARALVVGTTQNSVTPIPSGAPTTGMSSYHSQLEMRDNTLVNLPFADGKTAGAFAFDDYYVAAVDKGTVRNPNNRLIASALGYRSPPPALDGQPINNRNWTVAGAIWDPHGYVGTNGNYWVYDVPFLTTGANCAWVAPAGKNGKSCDGEYYGVQDFSTSFDNVPYQFMSPISATRLDSAGIAVGTWSVGDGTASTFLGNMRHFATRTGGRYVLQFPGKPTPTAVGATITNVYRSSDSFLLAVSFSGASNAAGYLTSWPNRDEARTWTGTFRAEYVRRFTQASSLAEVSNSNGSLIWQDRANNLVWVKIQGGLATLAATPLSDADLYRSAGLVLYSQ